MSTNIHQTPDVQEHRRRGQRPLSLAEVRAGLAGRPIELVDYAGMAKDPRSQWRCLTCGHEWRAPASSIRRGYGCGRCNPGVNPKLSVADIRASLADRPIELVSYAGSAKDSGSRWRCLTDGCGHEWKTSASSVREGTGCPRCGLPHARLTADRIRDDLADRPIELVEYAGTSAGISLWRCTAEPDHADWSATANNIRSGRGCPECNPGTARLSAAEIQADLADRPIELVEYVGNIMDPGSRWRCTTEGCGHEWKAPAHRVRKGAGCRRCGHRARGRRLRIDVEVIRAALAKRSIALVEYGGRSHFRSRFRCLAEDCGHEWEATTTGVRFGSGCPSCATGGLDPAAPAWLYLIRNDRLGAVKVGITGIEAKTDRLAEHARRGWVLVDRWEYPTGAEALAAERAVLASWEADGLPLGYVDPADMPQAGWTETTSLAMLDLAETVTVLDRLAAR